MAVSSPARWLSAVALSGAAFYFSTGVGEVWPFAWLAPLPILLLAFRASARTAFLSAIAAYFLGGLNLFSYLREVMPLPMVMAVLLGPAAVFALAVLAARYAVRRLPAWAAAFAFPAAWTSWEFLESLVSPHGTAGSLAYSQTDFLALLQLASVTGIWGITFAVTLVPSAVAVAWSRRSAAALAPAFAVLLVVLGFGAIRMREPAAPPDQRVGLAATDRGIGEAFATRDPAEAHRVAHAYSDRVARLAAQGAQVIVLPEKFVGVTPADSEEVTRVFRDAARAAHVTLVAGFNRAAIEPRRNVAVVFAPDGQILLEYEKRHMLPGPETGYQVGTVPGLFTAAGVRWGVAICKDMDFPAWLREYGRRGVRILAVPAWDFVRDARLHSRMAVMRAVENGFTLARVAQQGNLTFSDPYGRILAETSSGGGPEALLLHTVSPGPGATPYSRFGDWLGWASVLGLAALLHPLYFQNKKAGSRIRNPRAGH